jgi:hypothetical protein
VNYIYFKANAPGLRCAADASVFVQIYSNGQIVWEKVTPNPTTLIFGPGVTLAQLETYVFFHEQPEVIIARGDSHITVKYIAHYSNLINDKCNVGETEIGNLPQMDIP